MRQLSNGDLGWIQIANFLLTRAMTIATAVGSAGQWLTHVAVAGLGLFCLVAACLVMAQVRACEGGGLGLVLAITGLMFASSFIARSSGSGGSHQTDRGEFESGVPARVACMERCPRGRQHRCGRLDFVGLRYR